MNTLSGFTTINKIVIEDLNFSAGAIRKKDGEIQCAFNKRSKIILDTSFLITILTYILETILVFKFRNFMAIFYTLFTVIKLLSLTFTLLSNKDIRKDHAAEHMVINAYNKLDRMPTLEEVKTFSRFTPKCGTSYIITLPILLLVFLKFKLTFPIFLIKKLLNFSVVIPYLSQIVQFLTTAKPDDKNLILALCAMDCFLKVKKVTEI